MPNKISKRRRRVLLTSVLAALFLLATSATLWFTSNSTEVYRPGEEIEGLTATLERGLPTNYPRVTFTDATATAGINFHHFSGDRTSQLPEDMGSGAAWGDYDNDGWEDLYVVNMAGPVDISPQQASSSSARNTLYHNDGDGTFTEIAQQAGVDLAGWGMAAAWADYDNDGWLDLFVTAYGENVLYRNEGDGTFSDVTSSSRLGGLSGFWAGASWGDYNRDGWLDLYVTGYVRYVSLDDAQTTSRQYDVEAPASINPSSFSPERNLLYRNNGDGTFLEVGQRAGVANPQGRSLSAAWADFNDDGWPDLYVANDVSDNVLFQNMGNELFEEISHKALVADYRGAMGLAVGDWDLDQDLDIFVTHWIAQENALYNSMSADFGRGNLQFMDVADRFGLGQIALDFIGWGTFFFDYDNDGRLDLFVANGSTFQQKDAPHLLVPMENQLFWNSDNQHGFFDVSAVSGEVFDEPRVARGAAYSDYDNDGDLDVFVVNLGGAGKLLRNDGGNQKSWLKVTLEGRQSNTSGIGTRLRLVAGETVQIRQVGSQSTYLSQNSLAEHFGLGSQTKADTLEITWPGGHRQILVNLPANQTLRISEEGGSSL